MSQFSRRNSRSAASTSGFNCAPMEAVFVGSVGWTWNFTISSAGLKEVDLEGSCRIRDRSHMSGRVGGIKSGTLPISRLEGRVVSKFQSLDCWTLSNESGLMPDFKFSA